MSTVVLRKYQQEAVDSVLRDWKDHKSVIGTAATGSGKTIIFLSLLELLLAEKPKGRALIIAHRKELIDQPVDRMEQFYPGMFEHSGIVMAGQDDADSQVVVATVQTISMKRRLARVLEHGVFDWMIIDECFPAGTLVDGRPIESLQIGDRVRGGVVTELMVRPAPDRMVEVQAGGRRVTATPNHPFWTTRGWVAAGELREGVDYVATVDDDLRLVRQGIRGEVQGAVSRGYGEQADEAVLFSRMLEGWGVSPFIRRDGGDQSQVCLSPDARAQSDGEPILSGKDAQHSAGERAQASETGRERQGANSAAEGTGRGSRLAHGGDRADESAAWSRLSDSLQVGHSGLGADGGDRGGRRQSRHDRAQGSGQQEGSFFTFNRVERVTVHQSGSAGRPSPLCPDGKVYNIAVSPSHVYVANGFLVHNCHHAVADTYAGLVESLWEANPNMRVLGVTATPLRADNRGMVEVFSKESFHFDIRKGVSQAFLVPPRWLAIQTGISLAGVKTRDGDYVGKQLADVYETDNCFELVVESHKKYADGRQALAFVESVDGAYRLAKAFRDGGIVCEAADGKTPKDKRDDILRRFRKGEIQVLCNVGIYTEGLDVPQVSCIHMVRPTKSDSLYVQIIGRGLRTAPGKDDCLILDYVPAEYRNICMLGDVLGVPLRKDAYMKADAEEGEVVGGFTFDGNVKWMVGSAAEIVSRQLDYMDASPFSWHREGGWLSLGLGERDGVQRTLMISPPNGEGLVTLYGIAYETVYKRTDTTEISTAAFDEVSDRAQIIVDANSVAILSQKKATWRKQAASLPQEKYARSLGCWQDGMNKGDCAEAITHAKAVQAVKRIGAYYVA